MGEKKKEKERNRLHGFGKLGELWDLGLWELKQLLSECVLREGFLRGEWCEMSAVKTLLGAEVLP